MGAVKYGDVSNVGVTESSLKAFYKRTKKKGYVPNHNTPLFIFSNCFLLFRVMVDPEPIPETLIDT